MSFRGLKSLKFLVKYKKVFSKIEEMDCKYMFCDNYDWGKEGSKIQLKKSDRAVIGVYDSLSLMKCYS